MLSWLLCCIALFIFAWWPLTYSVFFWTILWTPIALLDSKKLFNQKQMIKAARWLAKNDFQRERLKVKVYHTHHPFFTNVELLWIGPHTIAVLLPTSFLGKTWDSALEGLFEDFASKGHGFWWSVLVRINSFFWFWDLAFWWFFSVQVKFTYLLFSSRSSFGKKLRDFSFFSLFLFYLPIFYTRAYLKSLWIPWMSYRLCLPTSKALQEFFIESREIKEKNPEKIFYHLFLQFNPPVVKG